MKCRASARWNRFRSYGMCHRNPLATLPEDPLIANKARDERGTVPDTGMSGPPARKSNQAESNLTPKSGVSNPMYIFRELPGAFPRLVGIGCARVSHCILLWKWSRAPQVRLLEPGKLQLPLFLRNIILRWRTIGVDKPKKEIGSMHFMQGSDWHETCYGCSDFCACLR
jgi:hypothetical protein